LLSVVVFEVGVAGGVLPRRLLVRVVCRAERRLRDLLFGVVAILQILIWRVEGVQSGDDALGGRGEARAKLADVVRRSTGVCPQHGVGHLQLLRYVQLSLLR
jgi:hypothetical protein